MLEITACRVVICARHNLATNDLMKSQVANNICLYVRKTFSKYLYVPFGQNAENSLL